MNVFPGDPAIRVLIGDIEVTVTDVQIRMTASGFLGSSMREITVHAILTDEMIEAAKNKLIDEEVVKELEAIRDDLS